MADNFNMKTFLAENKLGPYAKARLNENIEEEQLNEYEVIYQWEGSRCYRVTDEGYKDEVDSSYCRRLAEGKEESNENMNVASRIMAYADENKDKTSLEDTISGMLKYMSKEKILQYFKQMLVNSDKEKKEGYMGTQYDSSEDMAVDMVKKGIREMPLRMPSRMDRQTPDQRMEDIANQRYLAKFAEVAMMIAQDLDADGFDEQDIKRFLMTKLDDLILTEGTDIEKSLNEMITPSQIKLIQNIIDNWSDGGIDAEPAMMRIDKILMGDMSDEELDDEDLTGLNEALAPQSYERMSNLSNLKAQQAMIKAAEIMMNELTAEGFEVEEVREFFTQLIANDI
jgi:hypothetical protein